MCIFMQFVDLDMGLGLSVRVITLLSLLILYRFLTSEYLFAQYMPPAVTVFKRKTRIVAGACFQAGWYIICYAFEIPNVYVYGNVFISNKIIGS